VLAPRRSFICAPPSLDTPGPVVFQQERVMQRPPVQGAWPRTMVVEPRRSSTRSPTSTRPTVRCSRSRTTPASRGWGASSARPRSMSCRSSSTCSATR
jgi:hypothetical protein